MIAQADVDLLHLANWGAGMELAEQMVTNSDRPVLDTVQVEAAVQEADLRVLLIVVFQLSGDETWLQPPFLPKRDIKLIADEDAGLGIEEAQALRAEAVRLLSDPAVHTDTADFSDDEMVRLMSLCLGEIVPPEYAPMMREEMGFAKRQVEWRDTAPESLGERAPVVIVGAGASGIALGANLEALGIPYLIVEKNEEVGGTWYENTYPGCGVDTPNHAYSLSFASPYQWSRYFAPQAEIHDHLTRSADEAGLRPHIRFRSEVVRADWDDGGQFWHVHIRGPEGEQIVEASALVSAIGQLSLPSIPNIPGRDSFAGPIFHSAAWPKDLDWHNKRVAIVGTGASSMQIVPSIVDQVKGLSVFQRSPQWARAIPRYHDPIGPGAQWLLQNVPSYAAWYRFTMLWRYGDGLLPTLRKDPDWEHPDRAVNRTNDRHRAEMAAHIEQKLEGRGDLIAKCIPDYPAYGKRILLDNGWYDAIRKPNVELITDSVSRINARGLETADGEQHDADIVVLATGFKVGSLAARLNISGCDGLELQEAWKDQNPAAHLGIAVPGFPNFFCMQGPNTGLGHGGSAIFQAECQARYITGSLVRMIEEGIASMDVKQDIHDDYVRRVDAEHEAMIWTHPGMSTYYRNAKGRVISVMPWRLVDYWAMTHDPDLEEYDLSYRVT